MQNIGSEWPAVSGALNQSDSNNKLNSGIIVFIQNQLAAAVCEDRGGFSFVSVSLMGGYVSNTQAVDLATNKAV